MPASPARALLTAAATHWAAESRASGSGLCVAADSRASRVLSETATLIEVQERGKHHKFLHALGMGRGKELTDATKTIVTSEGITHGSLKLERLLGN